LPSDGILGQADILRCRSKPFLVEIWNLNDILTFKKAPLLSSSSGGFRLSFSRLDGSDKILVNGNMFLEVGVRRARFAPFDRNISLVVSPKRADWQSGCRNA
jgi:hypothetical protein